MKEIRLRWYQEESVAATLAAWQKNLAPVVVLPTGAGKSAVQGALARNIIDEGKRVLFLAHRKELISQNVEACFSFRVPASIYSASLHTKRITSCTVAQMQSFVKQARNHHFDHVCIDEAHMVPHDEKTGYRRIIDGLRTSNPEIKIMGLTATPYRLQGGMITDGNVFSHVAYSAPVLRLIDEGFLAPLSTKDVAQINLQGIATRGGEYAIDEMEDRATSPIILEAVATDVSLALQTRRCALVFGVSVAHCEALREAIASRGVSCAVVVGDSPDRDVTIARYKRGEIQCLISCDVLTTGFNHPPIDVIALVRATKSTALYVQMLGRGMRMSDGKDDCLVLDYGGNIERHGPVDAPRVKPKPKEKGEAPFKYCDMCIAQIPASARVCPICDAEQPEPEEKKTTSTKASKLAVLSANLSKILASHNITRTEEQEPLQIIERISARAHLKPGSDTPVVRLEYFAPDRKSCVHTDWLCPEHLNYARNTWTKFCKNIMRQVGAEFEIPTTVDDAVDMLNSGEVTCIAIGANDRVWIRSRRNEE